MSVLLLDNTRKINKLLHNNRSNKVVFNDICQILNGILLSNVLVISNKGKILGISNRDDVPKLMKKNVGNFIDKVLNERLLNVLSTMENANLLTFGFEKEEGFDLKALMTPISIAGERLATLFIYRIEKEFDIDDIIISEYSATVIGLEMMRAVKEEVGEEERKKNTVSSAISTLSSSELIAVEYIFNELKDDEGLLVASKMADRVGVTRSVIVNALRKLESAGVIKTHSSGMKGTYIKVLNNMVFEELKKNKD